MKACDYWEESVAQSLEEHGVTATKEQVVAIAADMQASHDSYGLAFYQPESPYPSEVKRLEAELRKERDMVVCRECKGRGRIYSQGPYHGSNSECSKCRGRGRHA